MVDADDVRRRRRRASNASSTIGATPASLEETSHRMPATNPPAKQIEAKPAPDVVVLSLVAQRWRGEGAPEILGLDELRIGVDRPDRGHRRMRWRGIG